MDIADFLRRVLPPHGYYAAITINGGSPRQKFLDDQQELADLLIRLSDRGENAYYAVSSFKDTTSRKQDNVLLTKAFYLDIDCGPGKPFADWRGGLVALGDFVTRHSLPKPLVVHSGNGLHVYWVLDEAIAPAQWKPMASALKALLPVDPETGKAMFDVSVPADSARVLRAVGTKNPKGGKVVRLLLDAPDVTVEQMQAVLGRPTPVVPANPRTSLLSALATKSEFPPANAATLVDKCAQIKWAVDNQGEVSEPFWYALMGIAAHCHNPEETAIAWSDQHPTYDQDKTLRKLSQWRANTTGPTTCAKFEEERPDGCKKCRFRERIGTPARLGLQYQTTAVSADAPDAAADVVPLPRPYKRAASGIKRTVDGTDIDVCNFEIYPLSYGRDETLGYEVVRFRWHRKHMGWQVLSFRQAYLTDQAAREFANIIADQGIVLFNKSQTESFQHMLRAYMDELRKMRAMTNLYSTMGWKDSNSQFLIGDTLIRRDENGDVERVQAAVSMGTQRNVDSMYGTSGNIQDWAMFTSLLERADMPIHMFALCVSFSAPLYQFTGLKGMTINLYGPTGAGKTLAQMWQQSIWGDPTSLHYTAKFTQNALFSRMGLYNNLPVTIDETTMMPAREVGDFLYWVSQGRDKARLSRSAEERDHKTWATPVTTSANRSMASMLAASGLESDAQMARLLEITINPHPLFTKSTAAGKRIYEFITTNYGAVGHAFLHYLVELGEDGIRAALAHHRAEFPKKYSCVFSGNERYWEQGIMLADFAGEIAQSLGLIQFDYRKGVAAVLQQLGVMRRFVRENSSDTFDLLTEYLNEHAGETLQVIHNGTPKPFVDTSRLPRGEVHVRYDLYGPKGSIAGPFDSGTVLVDRRHFKQWLAKRGADYRSVVRDINDQGVNATPAHDKAYLGKDSPIKLGQQYVLGISLKHERLEGILRDVDNAIVDAALSTAENVVRLKKP